MERSRRPWAGLAQKVRAWPKAPITPEGAPKRKAPSEGARVQPEEGNSTGRWFEVTLEEMLAAVKNLSRAERKKLKDAIDLQDARDEAKEAFRRSAGSWRDADVDGFLGRHYGRDDDAEARKIPR